MAHSLAMECRLAQSCRNWVVQRVGSNEGYSAGGANQFGRAAADLGCAAAGVPLTDRFEIGILAGGGNRTRLIGRAARCSPQVLRFRGGADVER